MMRMNCENLICKISCSCPQEIFCVRDLSAAATAAVFALAVALVKCGVKGIEVLCIEVILRDAQRITETLEVHDFTLAEEFNRFTYIGVVNQTQKVVLAFCSAARSSIRSVMTSPVHCRVAAEKGTPAALCG